MESAGIYRAAHARHTPFLAIRGISDVVGLKRNDPAWTEYACYTAAAFTHAFLPTLPTLPITDAVPARRAVDDIGDVRWMIVVEGEYKDFNKPRVEAIISALTTHLDGVKLRIERVQRFNSVAIHFVSARSVFERIRALFEAGELQQILDIEILDVRENRERVEKSNIFIPFSTPSKLSAKALVEKTSDSPRRGKTSSPTAFDVFLCYNSKDRDSIKRIARELRRHGLKTLAGRMGGTSRSIDEESVGVANFKHPDCSRFYRQIRNWAMATHGNRICYP